MIIIKFQPICCWICISVITYGLLKVIYVEKKVFGESTLRIVRLSEPPFDILFLLRTSGSEVFSLSKRHYRVHAKTLNICYLVVYIYYLKQTKYILKSLFSSY